MKVKKTDLPVLPPESDILPALDEGDLDDIQDEDDDDSDIEDDEVRRWGRMSSKLCKFEQIIKPLFFVSGNDGG